MEQIENSNNCTAYGAEAKRNIFGVDEVLIHTSYPFLTFIWLHDKNKKRYKK